MGGALLLAMMPVAPASPRGTVNGQLDCVSDLPEVARDVPVVAAHDGP